MKEDGVKLIIDASRCSGCRTCQLVCAMEHFGETNPKKAALKIVGHFPVPGHYEIKACTQCGQCVDVCPTEAIKKRDNFYYIDAEECTFCQACVGECPEGVLFLHPEVDVPIKCDACGSCAEYCAMKAITISESEGSDAR